MQGNPSNSHFSMSAFATVERRRREELLALQKQDRDQRQAQTTDEPVVPSPPEQQDSSAEQQDPPLHLFIEPALLPAQTELSPRPEESWAFGPPKVMKNGSCSATTVDGGTALPFVISTEAQPNFLLRDAGDDHVCGSPQREPHADPQKPRVSTGNSGERSGEICGSAALSWECFSTEPTRISDSAGL